MYGRSRSANVGRQRRGLSPTSPAKNCLDGEGAFGNKIMQQRKTINLPGIMRNIRVPPPIGVATSSLFSFPVTVSSLSRYLGEKLGNESEDFLLLDFLSLAFLATSDPKNISRSSLSTAGILDLLCVRFATERGILLYFVSLFEPERISPARSALQSAGRFILWVLEGGRQRLGIVLCSCICFPFL